ncbi:MAG TPA: hypothetical protein VNM48_09860 [Chloroflexota bacterium]|nr:hypothetical protein [Chloroflexota bacterium]
MALTRAGTTGAPSAPAALPTVSGGPALSTRETTSRPFVELGVMFGQALGGREPVMQALTNLQNIGGENGCDAVIAVKLLHYPTAAGPAVVAYGTGVRFLPQPAETLENGVAAAPPLAAAAGDGVASGGASVTGPAAATVGGAASPAPGGRAAPGA